MGKHEKQVHKDLQDNLQKLRPDLKCVLIEGAADILIHSHLNPKKLFVEIKTLGFRGGLTIRQKNILTEISKGEWYCIPYFFLFYLPETPSNHISHNIIDGIKNELNTHYAKRPEYILVEPDVVYDQNKQQFSAIYDTRKNQFSVKAQDWVQIVQKNHLFPDIVDLAKAIEEKI